MKTLERRIIVFAIIAISIVATFYCIHFYSIPLSKNISDWASLGDYFGGLLNPILSFLLIILIVKEAMDSRANYLDSRNLQMKSQEQIDEQIEYLKPKPELVYFLKSYDGLVHAVIENVGNAVAYNVTMDVEFEKPLGEFAAERYKRLSKLSFIPPKYKNGVFVSHINIKHKVIDIPSHKVILRFAADVKSDEYEVREYFVDDNMLSTVIKISEHSRILNDIANALKKLKPQK